MNEQKETTALNSSVGADEGQSPKTGNHSINDLSDDCNPFDVTELSDKPGLITVSMTELFNKVYQSKPPIIDGLLVTAQQPPHHPKRKPSANTEGLIIHDS